MLDVCFIDTDIDPDADGPISKKKARVQAGNAS
jgi:hypothetical protein